MTFLLQNLESLLGLDVQVLQILRPAALNEDILLVVLGSGEVNRQPLRVFVPLQASCNDNRMKSMLNWSFGIEIWSRAGQFWTKKKCIFSGNLIFNFDFFVKTTIH